MARQHFRRTADIVVTETNQDVHAMTVRWGYDMEMMRSQETAPTGVLRKVVRLIGVVFEKGPQNPYYRTSEYTRKKYKKIPFHQLDPYIKYRC